MKNMISRPILAVSTAVYPQTPLEDAIAHIRTLDVDGVVVKCLLPLPAANEINSLLEENGLKLLGLELPEYHFGHSVEIGQSVIQLAAQLKCTHVIIPTPRQNQPVTQEQAALFVADCTLFAQAGVSKNINIVVELRHRFETNLLNNSAQAAQFLARVGMPNIKLLVGTFDLMIEEQDGAGVVATLGDRIAFLRLSDSNAGPIGEGHLKLGAYLWSVQDLSQQIPILLDVKRPLASPFDDEAATADIHALLKKSRSWF